MDKNKGERGIFRGQVDLKYGEPTAKGKNCLVGDGREKWSSLGHIARASRGGLGNSEGGLDP